MRRRHLAADTVGISLLIAAIVWGVRWRFDPWRRLCRSVETSPITVGGRLSLIDSRGLHVLSVSRSADSTTSPSAAQLHVALAARDVLDSNAPAQQKATAALVAGYLADAEHRLAELVGQSTVSASVWSDYAVALASNAAADGRSEKLFVALASVDRAIDLEPENLPARFNRALILEHLGLRSQANDAYRQYLAVDRNSPWAADARLRSSTLASTDERFRWRDLVPQLERAAATNGSTSLIFEAVHRYPQEARTWTEAEFLGRWGQAFAENDIAQASTLLMLARSIASSLQALTDERMAAAAVAAIDRADPSQRKILAAAHVAYRQGRTQYAKRDVSGAIANLDKAQGLFQSGGSPMFLMALYYRASADVDLGSRRRARLLLTEIARRTSNGYHALEAQSDWLRGTMFGLDGQFGDAQTAYRLAADKFDRARERQNATEMRYRLASLLTILGQTSAAWQMQAECLSAASASGDIRGLEAAIYAAATDALREQRWDVGQSLLNLIAGMEGGNPRLHAEALVWRALAAKEARMQTAPEKALKDARAAVAGLSDPLLRESVTNDLRLVEARLLNERDPEVSIRLLTEFLRIADERRETMRSPEVLVERASLFRRQNRITEAEADLEKAIALVEARGIQAGNDIMRDSFLGRSRLAFDDLADLLDRRGDFERVLATCDRRRARVVLERIASRSGSSKAISSSEVLDVMPTRTVLLSYELLRDRVILLAITTRGLHRFVVPATPAELEAEVVAFKAAIERGDRNASKVLARSLHTLLLAPAETALSAADSLVIVADPFLQELPFSALVQADGRRLVESFTITFAPSVHTWVALRVRTPIRRPANVLVVGNPAFDRARYPSLPDLAAAETEAIAVGNMYPSGSLLTGGQASRSRVIDALRHSDVAHFATHAVADPTDAGRSRLVLAVGAEDPHSELTAAQVAAMDLRHVRLVVLAGCKTAVSAKGYGYIRNLAAAFLAAGVENVVASVWNVDDEVAREFSLVFHESIREGHAPTMAMRNAQVHLSRSGISKFSEERAWSSMQIYGAGL